MSGTEIGAIMSGAAALIVALVPLVTVIVRSRRERDKTPASTDGRHPVRIWTVVPLVLLSILFVALAGTTVGLVVVVRRNRPPPPLVIHITYPENQSSISQETPVKGYSTSRLSSDQHLWLVVEYGGQWWPQYGEAKLWPSESAGKYEFGASARIGNEDDVGRTFALRAIVVDAAVQERFENWLRQGSEQRQWFGISIDEVSDWGEVQQFEAVSLTRL